MDRQPGIDPAPADQRRRYWLWGMCGTLALLVLAVLAGSAELALSYNGRCGGYIPELSKPMPCSRETFVLENLELLGLIAWSDFWPLILAMLILPASIGGFIDRRAARRVRGGR